MSTKTMRLPPRRALTPSKRKEEDDFNLRARPSSKPPLHSNQLLAGYLAHEFLSCGTLFGKPWDSAAGSQAAVDNEPKRSKPRGRVGIDQRGNGRVYAEVSSLLKTGGSHIRGIVNPTELACFLDM